MKILENHQEWITSILKLFVYKTVKCEVINVAFLSRDLPLNTSEIMAKWKCLKVLYSSKGMYRIYRQLKRMIRLKYLFLETPYTFPLYSVGVLVLHTLNTLSPIFSGVSNNKFSFFGFSNLSFFVLFFTSLKKKIFAFKYF